MLLWRCDRAPRPRRRRRRGGVGGRRGVVRGWAAIFGTPRAWDTATRVFGTPRLSWDTSTWDTSTWDTSTETPRLGTGTPRRGTPRLDLRPRCPTTGGFLEKRKNNPRRGPSRRGRHSRRLGRAAAPCRGSLPSPPPHTPTPHHHLWAAPPVTSSPAWDMYCRGRMKSRSVHRECRRAGDRGSSFQGPAQSDEKTTWEMSFST